MSGLITLPRMGETMESGRVAVWLKKPGDRFERGETIAEIETDKVTVEMPALDAGRLTEILVPEGSEVAVGTPIGRYDAAGAVALPAATGEAAKPVRVLAELTLPRMGETMDEGRLSAWLKKPGETFKRGEMLAEIETDKVTVEMPALADGELVDILVAEGETATVGTPIARYAPTTDGAPMPQARPAPGPAGTLLPSALEAKSDQTSDFTPIASGERRRATPLARRLARQAGLDLAMLPGTGRRGRIEKQDIEAASARGKPGEAARGMASTSLPSLRFVDLPQGRMAYREWTPTGDARRTILFLHGFSAESGTWAATASTLARDGARVVAPDLPGHGDTAIAASDFEAICEAAATFAAALDLDGAEIMAHSLGGAVAIRLVAEARLHPSALTLLAPAGLGGSIDAEFVHGMASVTTGGGLAHLLRRLARRPPTLSRAQLDAMAQGFAAGRLKDLAAALAPNGRQGIDVVSDLATLTVPVRLLWGLEDRIMPWTQVAAAPPRTAIHLIADAGHMPHWDKPQDLAALLR